MPSIIPRYDQLLVSNIFFFIYGTYIIFLFGVWYCLKWILLVIVLTCHDEIGCCTATCFYKMTNLLPICERKFVNYNI